MSQMRSICWHEVLTSSVVSCTLARCQSMKVLSSFSSAQLFLQKNGRTYSDVHHKQLPRLVSVL